MATKSKNANTEGSLKPKKSFSAPDKDTLTFVFARSKFGLLRVAQFLLTLLCWNLSLHFKLNFENEDGRLLDFFLFAGITSWLYSIFSLALSLVVMKKRSHDLVRRIVTICSGLACAVFCFITSSLVADYIRRLHEVEWLNQIDFSCGNLISSAVFGFLATICFIMDAWYELHILKAIKDTALVSNSNAEESKSSRHF